MVLPDGLTKKVNRPNRGRILKGERGYERKQGNLGGTNGWVRVERGVRPERKPRCEGPSGSRTLKWNTEKDRGSANPQGTQPRTTVEPKLGGPREVEGGRNQRIEVWLLEISPRLKGARLTDKVNRAQQRAG